MAVEKRSREARASERYFDTLNRVLGGPTGEMLRRILRERAEAASDPEWRRVDAELSRLNSWLARKVREGARLPPRRKNTNGHT